MPGPICWQLVLALRFAALLGGRYQAMVLNGRSSSGTASPTWLVR